MILPPDVEAELTDTEFATRRHYSKRTYIDGCRGPLCKLRARTDSRLAYIRRRVDSGLPYEPSEMTRKSQRDEELIPIVKSYLRDFFDKQYEEELRGLE